MKRKIQRATSMGCQVAMALAIGCQIQPAGTPCDDGLCPEGMICAMPSDPAVLGTQKRCVMPGMCGNGVRDEDKGEECDDAEQNDDRGYCHKDCHVNHCNDRHVDPLEECDEGRDNGNERDCRSDCIINRCGDGFVDAGREDCDGAPQAEQHSDAIMLTETAECNMDCTWRVCGDGKVNHAAGEECDDGPNNGDDKDCRSDCIINRCGDGFANTNGLHHHEDCDGVTPAAAPGSREVNPEMTETCNSDCTWARCGDGIVNTKYKPVSGSDLTEQCDDRGIVDHGCSSTCQSEWCGNDVVDPGEECDGADGPQPCSTACRNEFCGNGRIDPGEVCDDRNLTCGSCSATCGKIISRRAVGLIIAVAGSALSDGETFTLIDGIHVELDGITLHPLVFEFNSNEDVMGGHVRVAFERGFSEIQVRQAIEDAIKDQHDRGLLRIVPVHDPDNTTGVLALLHDWPTSLGNQLIVSEPVEVGTAKLVTVGMADGEGGDCAPDQVCSSDDDCASHNCSASHRCNLVPR